MSTIIFLNGCGSSGKTSIAKAMQILSPKPMCRLGLDMLIDMMPSEYLAFGEKSKTGYFSFVHGENRHGHTVEIQTTELGDKIFSTLPKMAKIFADLDQDLIIDEVLLDDKLIKSYVKALKGHKTYFIGVHCELQVLIERELLREDRAIGLSNAQFSVVHQGMRSYDLTVDSTSISPFECAKTILHYCESTLNPSSFKNYESKVI